MYQQKEMKPLFFSEKYYSLIDRLVKIKPCAATIGSYGEKLL